MEDFYIIRKRLDKQWECFEKNGIYIESQVKLNIEGFIEQELDRVKKEVEDRVGGLPSKRYKPKGSDYLYTTTQIRKRILENEGGIIGEVKADIENSARIEVLKRLLDLGGEVVGIDDESKSPVYRTISSQDISNLISELEKNETN